MTKGTKTQKGKKKILLAGFEPFDGERLNSSGQAVERFRGSVIADREVVSEILPCAFGESLTELKRAIDRVKPELVLCIGQAGGRSAIGLERIAINLDDARIPDNNDSQPIDEPVVKGGPAAYWSTLPIKAIVQALNEARIKAEVSNTAGTFVCNHVFYGLMRTLKRLNGIRGGFIHVPYLPQQAKVIRKKTPIPSMSLRQITNGIEIAAETSLTVDEDLQISGGALH